MWTMCMWCKICYQWNAFTLTMLDYLCINIQTNYSLMYSIIFFPNLLMFMNIIPERHPHNMCMYVSKEQLGDKKHLVIVVLVSGIISLIMLIRNVQLAHSRNASKDCSCFQTMTLLHDSAILIHGSINGNDAFSMYRCVNMHMYMHMCAIRGIFVGIHAHERTCFILEELQHSALFLFCTPQQSAWYNWYWGT